MPVITPPVQSVKELAITGIAPIKNVRNKPSIAFIQQTLYNIIKLKKGII